MIIFLGFGVCAMRGPGSAEITALDFTHEDVALLCMEAVDKQWDELVVHEKSEAKRVQKEVSRWLS